MLGLEAEIDYILKNKNQSIPEIAAIDEQRKAMERAENLFRQNRELERRNEMLTYDLKESEADIKQA